MSAESSLTAVAVVRALLNGDTEGLAVLLPGFDGRSAPRCGGTVACCDSAAGLMVWTLRHRLSSNGPRPTGRREVLMSPARVSSVTPFAAGVVAKIESAAGDVGGEPHSPAVSCGSLRVEDCQVHCDGSA